MTDLSFLDIVPVLEHERLADAYRRAAEVARACEAAGYRRYWVAEHHGSAGTGGAATAVVLAHVGAATSRMRIGSGGIMLPNHAPMQIAEQFGTLDALYPGRIDLGLGRAPGTNARVAQALRRGLGGSADDFPRSVVELMQLFAGTSPMGARALPGEGADAEMWILGSSTFGAQLAAHLGLPFAFASHFSPDHLDEALQLYRAHFRPSDRLAQPHVMVACNAIAADTDREAEALASSMQQTLAGLFSGANDGGEGLPPPVPGYFASLPGHLQQALAKWELFAAVGSKETVRRRMAALLARTSADEIIVSGQIWDHAARLRSIALTAEAMAELA